MLKRISSELLLKWRPGSASIFAAVIVTFILGFTSVSVSGQGDRIAQFSAAVKWERFGYAERKLSVEFPKPPVAKSLRSVCSEGLREEYAAYAEETVYFFAVVTKSTTPRKRDCPRGIDYFNHDLLSKRVSQLADGAKIERQPERISGFDLETFSFIKETTRHYVIDDLQHGKWIEMTVIQRGDRPETAEKFFGSLALEASKVAREIGNGSDQTWGDDDPDRASSVESSNYQIVLRPRALYTVAARDAGTQGTVRLRVTLLSNGGIGTITPVTKLPHGLTEQAINAARRIVFLPRTVRGERVSVNVTIDYVFSIY
jgi:hypothetical protein